MEATTWKRQRGSDNVEATTRKRQRGSDNVEATTRKRQRGSDNVEMAGGVMHTINNRVAVKIFEENLNTVPLEKRDNVEATTWK